MKINKKIVALEWLLFCGLLATGFLIVFVLSGGNLFEALTSKKPIVWIVVFAPYTTVQLFRSIWWGIKTLTAQKPQ